MIRILESDRGRERLAGAAEFVDGFPKGTERLIVAATRDAADDFVREIGRRGGATFGLHRFSFGQLIGQLASLELAAAGLAPASSLGMEAVAARAVFEARESGAIPSFEGLSRSPGFARTVARSLSDIRLAGLDAAALRAEPASQELAAVLERVEQQLERAAVADRSRLVRLATEAIDGPAKGWLKRCPVAFLDVAVHSLVERDFIRKLCEVTPGALATVPAGDTPTLEALEPFGQRGLTGAPVEPGPDGLARLRRHLFSEATPDPGGADGDSVRFFSAPGEGRECVEIVRRVLAESAAGVPFDRMAVFVRTPASYISMLDAAFKRADIPAWFARSARRPDASGRAFLALLACREEGLSAQRFAEYLSFAQVPELEDGLPPADREVAWSPADDDVVQPAGLRPEPLDPDRVDRAVAEDRDDSPQVEGTLRAPRRWEKLLVEAAVIGGHDRWRRRLEGLARELEIKHEALVADEPESPRAANLARERANLDHLSRFCLPVIEALDALPEQGIWGEWLRGLRALCPRVLRRPERVLAVLADLEPMSAVGPVALDEVRLVLADRLATIEEKRPANRYGRVYVGTPDDARGRAFDVVFVPGLAERVFPQRPREDPLLLDRQRRGISDELDTQENRAHRERMLLRLAVGSAEQKLFLSYPRLDAVEARPRVPSFYALDVARAVEGSIPDFERLERDAAKESDARLSWPAPREPERAIDAIEHDLSVLGPLLRAPERESAGRARYLLGLNDALGRSLRGRWARWTAKRWKPEDGLVRSTEPIADLLDAQRPQNRPYSVTAIQKYSQCPYQFFLSAILRLAPREEPVPLVAMDALTKGRMFHEVQAEVMRALKERGDLPLPRADLNEARKLLDATIDRIAAQYREELVPAIERVWEDEVEAIRIDLRAWLRQVGAEESWLPEHFELGFGLPLSDDHDPESVRDPVELPGGWKLRGVIDVIERRADEVLRVTDNKTGGNWTREGMVVGGGEILQPVLYALTVEKLFGAEVAEGRLFYCTGKGGFTDRVVPLHEFARHYAQQVLSTLDAAIDTGMLPPKPTERFGGKAACQWCDFLPVCGPHEALRVRRKDPEAVADLEAIRKLP